jgi:hypothetical protein
MDHRAVVNAVVMSSTHDAFVTVSDNHRTTGISFTEKRSTVWARSCQVVGTCVSISFFL